MALDARFRSLLLPFAASAALTACGHDDASLAGKLVVERDTVGDTVVVRTVSGSAWGGDRILEPEVSIGAMEGDPEYLFGQIGSLGVGPSGTIYVVDRQVPDLRAYAPDGTYIATLGRPGEGPGELKGPDGGLAVLSDGRVLVRDPGNARIQVYGPDGKALETWTARGGFSTSSPLYRTRDDHVHTQILVDPKADLDDWVIGLVDIAPDGTPGDTLIPPDAGYEAPYIEARVDEGDNHSVSRNSVPFSPTEQSVFSPDGYWIHAISTDYRIDLLRRDAPPLRIERVYEAVPVTAGEKAEEERLATRNMRYTNPDWRWNGPPIPDRKPPFTRILTGRDGRIWVVVSQPAVEVDDPTYDPKDRSSVPDRWREPIVFDVFEPNGTYLGRVRTPMGFSLYPWPVFDADHVWAIIRDDLGVQKVVRYRIRADSAVKS